MRANGPVRYCANVALLCGKWESPEGCQSEICYNFKKMVTFAHFKSEKALRFLKK